MILTTVLRYFSFFFFELLKEKALLILNHPLIKERKNLSTKSLLKFISNYFETIEDEERKRTCHFSLKDCLMSGIFLNTLDQT